MTVTTITIDTMISDVTPMKRTPKYDGSASSPAIASMELYAQRRLRALAAGAMKARSTAELDARSRALAAQSPELSAALDRVSWMSIRNLLLSASRHRLLFFKINGHRISGWDVLNGRRGCPHCASTGQDGGDVHHIVWQCPAAQRLWRTVRSWWSSLSLWVDSSAATERDFFTAIFSLRLPRTPSKVWELASLPQCSRTDDAPEGPYPALQAAWQQVVLETLVVIIGWRHSRFDPDQAWTATKAAVNHNASYQRVLLTLAHRCASVTGAPALTRRFSMSSVESSIAVPGDDAPPPPPSPEATHVLFFDSGSRGNPGPGGSGACVVGVDEQTGRPALVWSASMSHAHRSTTNNQAEYRGLITGLRAARHYQWSRLEVVGDTTLILRQLRDYRPPKNPRLLALYAQARRLADRPIRCEPLVPPRPRSQQDG